MTGFWVSVTLGAAAGSVISFLIGVGFLVLPATGANWKGCAISVLVALAFAVVTICGGLTAEQLAATSGRST